MPRSLDFVVQAGPSWPLMRPLREFPVRREYVVKVRLSDEEMGELEMLARDLRATLSSAVRQAISRHVRDLKGSAA